MRTWAFPVSKPNVTPPARLFSLYKLNGRSWMRISEASYSRFNAEYVFKQRIIESFDKGIVVDIREISL